MDRLVMSAYEIRISPLMSFQTGLDRELYCQKMLEFVNIDAPKGLLDGSRPAKFSVVL